MLTSLNQYKSQCLNSLTLISICWKLKLLEFESLPIENSRSWRINSVGDFLLQKEVIKINAKVLVHWCRECKAYSHIRGIQDHKSGITLFNCSLLRSVGLDLLVPKYWETFFSLTRWAWEFCVKIQLRSND